MEQNLYESIQIENAFNDALRGTHPEYVENFVEKVIDAVDQALLFASIDGDTTVVKFLIETGSYIHSNNEDALRSAADLGHTDVVKLLLHAGANIHAVDDGALHNALINKHFRTSAVLIDNGANYNNNWDLNCEYEIALLQLSLPMR